MRAYKKPVGPTTRFARRRDARAYIAPRLPGSMLLHAPKLSGLLALMTLNTRLSSTGCKARSVSSLHDESLIPTRVILASRRSFCQSQHNSLWSPEKQSHQMPQELRRGVGSMVDISGASLRHAGSHRAATSPPGQWCPSQRSADAPPQRAYRRHRRCG